MSQTLEFQAVALDGDVVSDNDDDDDDDKLPLTMMTITVMTESR